MSQVNSDNDEKDLQERWSTLLVSAVGANQFDQRNLDLLHSMQVGLQKFHKLE